MQEVNSGALIAVIVSQGACMVWAYLLSMPCLR